MTTLIVVGCIVGYIVVGAFVGAIAAGFSKHNGESKGDQEISAIFGGMMWPLTVVMISVVLLYILFSHRFVPRVVELLDKVDPK